MIVNSQNYHIDHLRSAKLITAEFKSNGIDRKRHLLEAMTHVTLAGHVMEFGVYRGKTMQHISTHFAQQTCWGFDSFQGLPEPWYTHEPTHTNHPAGHFDLRVEQELPVFAPNVRLVAGWFQDTIPAWLANNAGPVSFLHVDCDLYSSARTVLHLLNDRVVPGSILVFDEMCPWTNLQDYPLWSQGEYKALAEWVSMHDREFEPLLRNSYQQCTIKILR